MATLNLFFAQHPDLPPPNVSQEWFLLTWFLNDMDLDIQRQVFLISAATKIIAQKMHCDDSFARLKVDQCHARVIGIVKLAMDAASAVRVPARMLNLFYDWLFDNFLDVRYSIYEVFRLKNVPINQR